MKRVRLYLVFALIPIMICIAIWVNKNHFDKQEKEIHQWVSERGYIVVDEDLQWTPIGTPFHYLNKGEYIWKLNVKDSLDKPYVVWVRTTLLYGKDYGIKN